MNASPAQTAPADLAEREAALRERLSAFDRLAIALSGGVDSACLTAVAFDELGAGALALTAETALASPHQIATAAEVATHIGVAHRFVEVDLLSVDPVRENAPDRCYHCKRAILSALRGAARAESVDHIAEGSTADDADDDRPGLRAVREAGVVSPLAEAGFAKAHVRALARRLGLPVWDAAPDTCCATRIPTGQALSAGVLTQVSRAEEGLRALGLPFCRVRHHGEVARIEAPPEWLPRLAGDLRNAAESAVREAGYRHVALDLAGYRPGSVGPGRG